MSAEKLPKGWVETQLENIVDILDSMRVPVNNSERQSRIAGKKKMNFIPILVLPVKSVKLMIIFLMKNLLH